MGRKSTVAVNSSPRIGFNSLIARTPQVAVVTGRYVSMCLRRIVIGVLAVGSLIAAVLLRDPVSRENHTRPPKWRTRSTSASPAIVHCPPRDVTTSALSPTHVRVHAVTAAIGRD